jgi:glycosyltransferase involved in cell wall biosynthesis
MLKKILIKGPVLSRSGYGEQSRFALKSVRSRSDLFDIYIINIPWGRTGQISVVDEESDFIHETILKTQVYVQQGGQFDISLQITIPNEFEKIAPINIGYTAGIETNKVAPEWIQKSNTTMDRLITISNHSAKVFKETTYDVTDTSGNAIPGWGLQIPIDYVDYPVRTCGIAPRPLDLKLETDKNFLVIAQWGTRKNLDNTVRWFIEEFKDDADVGLIIKTNNASDSIIDRDKTFDRMQSLLSTCPEHQCKIYVIHGELTENELVWLYTHPTSKAFISLAHGEGFGLPIFEAACNGLPIITITWGGQLDFITIPNKKGKLVPKIAKVDYDVAKVQQEAVWPGVIVPESMWAYAREWSYKRALRDVLNKEKHYTALAQILQKHIMKTLPEDKQNALFVEYILDACGTTAELLSAEQSRTGGYAVKVLSYE